MLRKQEKAEQALADALLAKITAYEIDGKASDALSTSKRAESSANDAKNIAEVTRDEVLAIIREQTSGGDIVPEVVQARGDYDTLGEHISAIDQELAQKVDEDSFRKGSVDYKSNSKGYLEIPVYNNPRDYQATHPSVLYFENGWNGYRFWQAMTPYEYENESLENPSIVASNDGLNWEVPKGLTNPLASTPNARNMHYSDTHLVFVGEQLEVWYRKRERNDLPAREYIVRKVSTDGVNWTDEEVLYSRQSGAELLSPVVIYDEGKYKIWTDFFYGNKFEYWESSTGRDWVKVRDIPFPKHPNNLKPWHMDIKRTSRGYEMYYCAGRDYNATEIAYAVSDDNETYEYVTTVISRMPQNFDEKRLYRPSFVDLHGKRYLYYGGTTNANRWYIGLTVGQVNNPTVFNGAELASHIPFYAQTRNELNAPNGVRVGAYGILDQDRLRLATKNDEQVGQLILGTELENTIEFKNKNGHFMNIATRELKLADLGSGQKGRPGLRVSNEALQFFYRGYYQNISLSMRGTTAERPTNPHQGFMYFDTTLKKPVWYDGIRWKDALGEDV